MPSSTQLHPCLLVMNGMAAARAELRAAVEEDRPAKLASEFLGALGEVQAAHVLGPRHASHIADEYDLEDGTVAIEVKSTMRGAIGNVCLAEKACSEVLRAVRGARRSALAGRDVHPAETPIGRTEGRGG